jgi:hypothetical protein
MAVWKSLTVNLPAKPGGWGDSSVGTVSVWGDGNDGQDLWGYYGANEIVHVNNIVAHDNGTAQVKIDLLLASKSTRFAVVMRLIRNGQHEVFCQNF